MGYDPKHVAHEEHPPVRRSCNRIGLWVTLLLCVPLVIVMAVGMMWTLSVEEAPMRDAPYSREQATTIRTTQSLDQAVDFAVHSVEENEFTARLRAAQLITDPLQRNEALVKLSTKAATISSRPALELIQAITDPLQREKSAERLAVEMSKAGNAAGVVVASTITDPQRMADAVEAIAVHAAESNAGQMAVAALDLVTDPLRKSEIAFQVSRALSELGDAQQATEAAQKIGDPLRRNAALRYIAQDEWPADAGQ